MNTVAGSAICAFLKPPGLPLSGNSATFCHLKPPEFPPGGNFTPF